ncbi:MAG: DegV family protein [Candidatus Izemoplasmataceae bacterium]
MSKIGLVVCGNSGIDYLKHDYDIRVIRSTLLFGEDEYTDFVDITAEEFYQKLEENPELSPSTAQTATGVILETYETLKKDGYDEILVITISSKLSGTHEGAKMAANMIEGVKVTVFDSLSVAYPEAYMVLTAAEMIKNGKKIPEILDKLVYIREHQGILVSVDTLKYLVKNGRLSGASGFLGSILKIKPMLHLTREGKIEPLEKIRTRSKALSRIVEKFAEDHYTDNAIVFIAHANAFDEVDWVKQALMEHLPNLKSIEVTPLTPVVGAHAGPKTLAIGWVPKK